MSKYIERQQNGPMDVTFSVVNRLMASGGFEKRSFLKVSRGPIDQYDDKKKKFSATLLDHLETGDPIELYNLVRRQEVPEHVDGVPFHALEKSIEGQHLLERIVADYGCRYPLVLPKPAVWLQFDPDKKAPKNSWKAIERPTVDPTKRFLEEVDDSHDRYTYTLRVVDHDKDNQMYYVGQSVEPIGRLRKHISVGGDFSKAHRLDNTHVHEIVRIEPATKLSESEMYEEMDERVNDPVYGGK